jgi:hypothetical protein
LDGSVWLCRISKANKRTQKLQAVASGLPALEKADVGSFCIAREMSDNLWYRAEVTGHTRLYHTIRLLDFGRSGEAVELKKWWGKEDVEARRYSLKCPANLGMQFLAVKKDWRDGKAVIYSQEVKCVS